MARWKRFIRNPAAVAGTLICLGLIVVAIFAPAIAPYPPDQMLLGNRHLPPSPGHWMGTDFFGRDILSRIIIGSRITVAVGLIALLAQAAIGIPLGLAAGYFKGRIDMVIMRLTDIFMSFPTILLALAIMAVSGGGFWNLILALSITSWTSFSRLVRSQVLTLTERDFVQSSHALGARDLRTIFRQILPNCIPIIIVHATLVVAVPILAESSLSFLGLGLPPETSSWGAMAATGRAYIREAWWSVTFPGLAIAVVVLGTNLLGDALRDVLDPKM
ncbi:MAG: ABC transporter permease [Trueperaceae bacterium]